MTVCLDDDTPSDRRAAGARAHSDGALRRVARPVPGRAHDLVRRRRLPDAQRARGGLALHAGRPARRSLLTAGPSDDGAVLVRDHDAPEGVTLLRPAADQASALGSPSCPADRAAVAAWNGTADGALCIGIPAEAELAEPVVVAPAWAPSGRRGNGHTVVERRPAQPRDGRARATPARRSYAGNVEIRRRRRRRAHRRHRAGLGRRRRSTWPSTTRSSAATPGSSTSR